MTAKLISPIDGAVLVERPFATDADLERALAAAHAAQRAWAAEPLAARKALATRALEALLAAGPEIAPELTAMMGRPIRFAPGEMRGVEERARHMIAIADRALAPIVAEDGPTRRRKIAHEPLGLVLVIAPWNYPYLTAVNAIVPAIVAGNAVILKHATQTLLAGDRFAAAFAAAGAPEGLFQSLTLSHDQTERLLSGGQLDHASFTGSVAAGRAIERAAAGTFTTLGLELGGKDPAYVRADADLENAVEGLIDGAMFNSGQCCCGIERIYVAEPLFDAFVDKAVSLVEGYRLGDPRDGDTTLGPMAHARFADLVRRQTAAAVADGARALIDPALFPAAAEEGPYLAPQLLVDVHHDMAVMREESFGPVVGIMPVRDDAEALRLMNDSPYGLTAAIWTADLDAAERLGAQIETGTVFMNRCDYLDPALCWTGRKATGRGGALSEIGYRHLTRPKSYHLRVVGA
jgi:acyl-CoA reductase-like NAD-dependent aldehyde dehydrogenase